MIKLKNILLEKKDLDATLVKHIGILTNRNAHTEARIELSKWMKNKKLAKFYNAMNDLNDVFGGYGPELSKLNQKMEKVLYKEIQRNYSNAKEIVGSL
jgi:hypothetical protein